MIVVVVIDVVVVIISISDLVGYSIYYSINGCLLVRDENRTTPCLWTSKRAWLCVPTATKTCFSSHSSVSCNTRSLFSGPGNCSPSVGWRVGLTRLEQSLRESWESRKICRGHPCSLRLSTANPQIFICHRLRDKYRNSKYRYGNRNMVIVMCHVCCHLRDVCSRNVHDVDHDL